MVKLTGNLRRPDAELRFADRGGDGPAVVFTHGAGMDHTMFEAQADALGQAGHRTVLWDLRGHGESAQHPGARFTAAGALADLAALLDKLGIDRPVLVGHSLGGNLSQTFVRRHAGRAGGLVVLDSTWNTGPLSGVERLGLGLSVPMLRLIPAARLPGLMARASAVSPEAVARIEATFRRMPKAAFLDVWRATVSLVSPDPAYRTPVPLGLIRGAEDRTGNIAAAMPRWARAEGVSEQVIPGAGHVVTLDAPDATTRALLRLLEQWRLDEAIDGARDGARDERSAG
ncbi:alpha/beta hydrolase [Nonomuraea sp. WAC 01424]|uniref:alpha/beta fold hydrolase n=1 Tax=Nonomuraea sp. WAC 01424 TaxID=2203200 RepID=UPI000F7A3059|nr:alpha/beta hydrolase [Nonomuraea sp. WAC 01424]RSN11545.1 alpha/beta hydrolase [Nonomuraea sp. WAC 01424]